ncbi:MAG: M20/M25/M40 family metallo-hydrolase [Alteromonadaceae bacterium]|nr:M20/M25/M40 family metallo-hydrolase [Alteromonadaceae bacterium]
MEFIFTCLTNAGKANTNLHIKLIVKTGSKKMNKKSILILSALTIGMMSAPTMAAEEEQTVWITIASDAAAELQQAGGKSLDYNYTVGSDTIVVAQLDTKNLSKLSRLMHNNHHRCGGYIAHDSLTSAMAASQSQSLLLAGSFTAPPIEQQTRVNAQIPNLSASNIVDTINYLSTNFNNRYYTTSGGVASSNGLKDRWAALASGKSYASVSQYTHAAWAQKSVIMTLTGSEYPDEFVIIGGHLDSTIGSTSENSIAPGADDDASGIASLTEVLRVMLSQGIQPKRTIQFMAYAAEEVGLRGSKEIAEQYSDQGKNVVGVLQLDMTNYNGSANDITFMTDYTNADQNNYLQSLLDAYLPSISYGTDQCGYGCSDHASWTNNGFPASMPFESRMSQYNPTIHSSNDTLANSDSQANHALKFAKLALAYAIEMTEADSGPDPEPNVLTNNVPVNNLGESAGSDVTYTFDVPAGATDISFNMSGGSGDADLYVKFGSAPTDSSYDCRPYVGGNNESCTGSSSNGTYHVRLKAYSTFSGVSLVASYTEGGTGPTPIDETESNISVSSGQWKHYTQTLQSGYSTLTVTMSGGSGDADLYVRQGAQSTTSSYDCRPYKNGNSEVCTFNSPAAGTWYFDIRGYSAASGVTLNWTAN